MMLSVILATQFSFGRMFATATVGSRDLSARGLGWLRGWFDQRRREQARREVIAKHTKKRQSRRRCASRPRLKARRQAPQAAAEARARGQHPRAPAPVVGRRKKPETPSLAARSRAAEGAGAAEAGTFTLPPLALLDAPEGRAQDRRARADGPGASARGEVQRVLGGRPGGADPSRPGGHDLRVQARSRREVQQDHRARRRPVPGDAGRVGAHRPHPGQVHRRHPDSEPQPRGDLAAGAARVRRLPALALEADARARQDDPRRALLRRPGHDAAPADRRLDRHRQVGRPQRDAHQHPLPRDARRRAVDHDRSQAARARDVRGHSAPAHAGRHRSEEGGQRAALGGARDGRALQDAGGRGRPQHRAVQPQHPAGAAGSAVPAAADPERPSRCPSSSSSSTSWPT